MSDFDFLSDKTIGQQIKDFANDNNVSVSYICLNAKVGRDTLERMKNKDSKTICTLKKLAKVMADIKSGR